MILLFFCYTYDIMKLLCSNDKLGVIKENNKGMQINNDVRNSFFHVMFMVCEIGNEVEFGAILSFDVINLKIWQMDSS